MKQIYTTLAAVALGVATAAAAVPATNAIVKSMGEKVLSTKSFTSIEKVADLSAKHADKAAKSFKAPRREAEAQPASPAGEFIMIYGPIFKGYPEGAFTSVVDIEVDDEGNVTFPDFLSWGDYYAGYGFADAENIHGYYEDGVLEIPAGQILGTRESGGSKIELILEAYDIESEQGGWSDEVSFVMSYEDGAWVSESAIGIGYYQDGQFLGFWDGVDVPTFMAPNADISFSYSGYDSNGNIVERSCEKPVISFFDIDEEAADTTLIISYFGIQPTGMLAYIPYYSDVQCAKGSEIGSYFDPEDEWLFSYGIASANYWDSSLTIVLDCANPDDIIVPLQDSYYFDLEDGSKDFINNWGEAYLYDNPEDGKRYVYSYGKYDCAHIVSRDPASGIQNVAADAVANGPAVYYNLQGVRVANPANGLYIVKQGNKASKVLVK